MQTTSFSSGAVTFDHLTFNTGHNHRHCDFELDADIASILRPLCKPGPHELGSMGFRGCALLMSHRGPYHAVFTVSCDALPVLTCHACLDDGAAETVWEAALAGHRAFAEAVLAMGETELAKIIGTTPPLKRPTGRFLSVHLAFPSTMPPGALGMLADFERCLYWTLWSNGPVSANTPVHGWAVL